jgi:hypothetical protein
MWPMSLVLALQTAGVQCNIQSLKEGWLVSCEGLCFAFGKKPAVLCVCMGGGGLTSLQVAGLSTCAQGEVEAEGSGCGRTQAVGMGGEGHMSKLSS